MDHILNMQSSSLESVHVQRSKNDLRKWRSKSDHHKVGYWVATADIVSLRRNYSQ